MASGRIFDSNSHSQGYATEACKAVLRRAFDQLQACRVFTGTVAINQSSCRLLEQLGFNKVGEEITSFKAAENGEPIEFLGYHYTTLQDEWQNINT